MNIGILGTGNVGGALGERCAKLGHNVVFGTRKPEDAELRDLLKRSGPTARHTDIAGAAKQDVIVLALPFEAAKTIAASLDLRGKIVFDCSNPLRPDLSGLAVGGDTSAGEQIAQLAKGASVVKIFNTTGANNMANPEYHGSATAMFYCGGDDRAKAVAKRLAQELGFEPIDAGPIENARLLEALAMLWIWLAYPGGLGSEIAFRLVNRAAPLSAGHNV